MPRGPMATSRSSSASQAAAGTVTPTPIVTDGSAKRPTPCESSESVRVIGSGFLIGTAIAILSCTGRFQALLRMLQMNLRLGPEDLNYVVQHSKAKFIAVDESLLPAAEVMASQVTGIEGWILLSDKPIEAIKTSLAPLYHYEALIAASEPIISWPEIDERSAYSACYTTGTTGRPKGIYYSHRAIYLHSMTMATALGMTLDDCTMLITPMFHGQCWGLPQAATLMCNKIVLPGRYMAEDTAPLTET